MKIFLLKQTILQLKQKKIPKIFFLFVEITLYILPIKKAFSPLNRKYEIWRRNSNATSFTCTDWKHGHQPSEDSRPSHRAAAWCHWTQSEATGEGRITRLLMWTIT